MDRRSASGPSSNFNFPEIISPRRIGINNKINGKQTKNDVESMASTWHSGYVGMVSFDRVNEIAGVVVEATKEFKDEFERLN